MYFQTRMTLFNDKYRLGRRLGKGGHGQVNIATDDKGEMNIAIKQIQRNKIKNWVLINGQRYPREVVIMNEVANIEGSIKLIEFEEDQDGLSIAMEYMEPSMDLYDYISKKGTLEEEETRIIFKKSSTY